MIYSTFIRAGKLPTDEPRATLGAAGFRAAVISTYHAKAGKIEETVAGRPDRVNAGGMLAFETERGSRGMRVIGCMLCKRAGGAGCDGVAPRLPNGELFLLTPAQPIGHRFGGR